MNDRLRNERGRYSTAEETSDHEKGILNPEITGQTLAQHSEKGLLTPENTAQHEKGFLSSLSTGTADTQMTVTAAIAFGSHEKSEVAIFRTGRANSAEDNHRTTRQIPARHLSMRDTRGLIIGYGHRAQM